MVRGQKISRSLAVSGAVVLLLGQTGCLAGGGALYSHVTVPLDVNLDRTPVHRDQAQDALRTFNYFIRVDWGSDGIGDIAKRHGFKRVYYADLETLTVLGVWRQRWAHVYGER